MKYLFTLSALLFSLNVSAKNLILFIGDGMGPAVVSAARLYNKKPLAVDNFSHTAIIKTHSTNNHVTDSAAAGTAIATGFNTDNGVVGMGQKELKTGKTPKDIISLARFAKQQGKSVAIITDASIVDATPAAFYAKAKSRYESESIMTQLFDSGLDLFVGGGKKLYEKVKDKNKNYQVVTSTNQWNRVKNLEKPVLYLTADKQSPFLKERSTKQGHPRMHKILKKTIKLLSKNPKGYFIMLESAHIDKALHFNEIKWTLNHALDLNQSITAATKVANAKDTLMVVTADHDTSGLSINGYPNMKKGIFQEVEYKGAKYPFLTLSTGPKSPHPSKSGAHTGVDIHLFANGKGAEKFHGTMHHVKSHELMKEYLKSN